MMAATMIGTLLRRRPPRECSATPEGSISDVSVVVIAWVKASWLVMLRGFLAAFESAARMRVRVSGVLAAPERPSEGVVADASGDMSADAVADVVADVAADDDGDDGAGGCGG